MLTEQRFKRSEKLVWETGFMALVKSLGYADALRFLAQVTSGQGDYLEWQDQVFGETSVDELYEQAQAYWQKRKTNEQ
jgi:hypothetical protein